MLAAEPTTQADENKKSLWLQQEDHLSEAESQVAALAPIGAVCSNPF